MVPLGVGRVWGVDELTRDTHHLRISLADDATKATIVEQRDYSRAAYGTCTPFTPFKMTWATRSRCGRAAMAPWWRC